MHPASKTLRGVPVHNLSDQIMNWASSKCKFSHRLRIKLRINFALPIHKMSSWSPLILGILALATLNTTAAEVTSRTQTPSERQKTCTILNNAFLIQMHLHHCCAYSAFHVLKASGSPILRISKRMHLRK